MSHKYYPSKKPLTKEEHEALLAKSARLQAELKREIERMRTLIEKRSRLT